MSVNIYSRSNLLQSLVILVTAALALQSSQAFATTYEYDVRGDAIGVEVATKGARSVSNWYFDRGNVVLTIDDRDTATLADDTLSISGILPGAIGKTGVPLDGRTYRHNGIHEGEAWFDFESFTLTDPITNPNASRTSTGSTELAFGQQTAGVMRVVNEDGSPWKYGHRLADDDADLLVKNDRDYAFAIFPDPNRDDGSLIGEGWLAIGTQTYTDFFGEGRLGGRLEFGPKNVNLNWDMRLIPRHVIEDPPPMMPPDPMDPPTQPMDPIPEPGTLMLLASGLVGLGAARKKQHELRTN